MKGTLSTLGLGALLCLPCLAIGLGLVGFASGGAILAVGQQPVVQAAGAVAGLVGLALAARPLLRRGQDCRECEIARARGVAPDSTGHELHAWRPWQGKRYRKRANHDRGTSGSGAHR